MHGNAKLHQKIDFVNNSFDNETTHNALLLSTLLQILLIVKLEQNTCSIIVLKTKHCDYTQ